MQTMKIKRVTQNYSKHILKPKQRPNRKSITGMLLFKNVRFTYKHVKKNNNITAEWPLKKTDRTALDTQKRDTQKREKNK